MVELVGKVGDGVGHLGHPHHAVHELKMSGERADIGIITLLLRNFEIEYGFLVRLNHAGTGEDARVALGFPVVLNPFVAHFQNGVDDLLAFVFALGLAGSTKDEVVGKVVRVLEDYLHLGPWLHAEGTYVVLHLRLHGRDGHLLVNLLETRRDGEVGETVNLDIDFLGVNKGSGENKQARKMEE